MSLCDDCILNGRCDGRCGDTDPTYYDFEAENDRRDEYERESDCYDSDAQVRGHLNRLNSIIDAHGLKFEAVMDLATKAFDAVAALEKAIPQTEN